MSRAGCAACSSGIRKRAPTVASGSASARSRWLSSSKGFAQRLRREARATPTASPAARARGVGDEHDHAAVVKIARPDGPSRRRPRAARRRAARALPRSSTPIDGCVFVPARPRAASGGHALQAGSSVWPAPSQPSSRISPPCGSTLRELPEQHPIAAANGRNATRGLARLQRCNGRSGLRAEPARRPESILRPYCTVRYYAASPRHSAPAFASGRPLMRHERSATSAIRGSSYSGW